MPVTFDPESAEIVSSYRPTSFLPLPDQNGWAFPLYKKLGLATLSKQEKIFSDRTETTLYHKGRKSEEFTLDRQGEKQGKHTYYSPDGVRLKTENYRDGRLHGMTTEYDSGRLDTVKVQHHHQGRKIGHWEEFNTVSLNKITETYYSIDGDGIGIKIDYASDGETIVDAAPVGDKNLLDQFTETRNLVTELHSDTLVALQSNTSRQITERTRKRDLYIAALEEKIVEARRLYEADIAAILDARKDLTLANAGKFAKIRSFIENDPASGQSANNPSSPAAPV